MHPSRTVRTLQTVGCYWFPAVLVGLIASTIFPAARTFLWNLTLVTHLALWVTLLVPGVVLVVVAERMARTAS